MPYTTFKGTIDECTDRLNGVLQLGPYNKKTGLPVGGRTLIFTSPSATTVTFTGSVGDVRTIDQIIADFTAQLPAVGAKFRNYDYGPNQQLGQLGIDPKVVLLLQADAGITITDAGTANAFFGLSTSASTTRTIVAAADVVTFGPSAHADHYVLVIAP